MPRACLPADLVLVFIIPAVYNALLFHFIRALSGWLFLLLAAYCAWRLELRNFGDRDRFQCRCVVVVQLIMLPAAIWNLVSTAQSIQDKNGLLLINQIVSWSMLGEYVNCQLTCDLILFTTVVIWVMMYHLVGRYQNFRITCFLYLQCQTFREHIDNHLNRKLCFKSHSKINRLFCQKHNNSI